MTKLSQCSQCQGFLPRGATTCPHCSSSARRAITKKLCAVGATLGAGSIAFTLMACYGAPPCADGTRECYKSPRSVPSGEPEAGAEAPLATPDAGATNK